MLHYSYEAHHRRAPNEYPQERACYAGMKMGSHKSYPPFKNGGKFFKCIKFLKVTKLICEVRP